MVSAMNISIRSATSADVEIIVRFNSRLAEETEDLSLDQPRLRSGIEALLLDPSKGLYFLAVQDGIPVGQLMITYEWSDWRNGTFWWIQSVYVEKSARGSGVFQSLYEYVRALAHKRRDVSGIRLYVDKSNDRAKRTYERLGMKLSHYEMFELDFVL